MFLITPGPSCLHWGALTLAEFRLRLVQQRSMLGHCIRRDVLLGAPLVEPLQHPVDLLDRVQLDFDADRVGSLRFEPHAFPLFKSSETGGRLAAQRRNLPCRDRCQWSWSVVQVV